MDLRDAYLTWLGEENGREQKWTLSSLLCLIGNTTLKTLGQRYTLTTKRQTRNESVGTRKPAFVEKVNRA
jgi:hypothetical protein